MAAVTSTMLPLGTPAPDFTLPDTVSGKPVNLTAYRAGKPLLVAFICNHCPYVVHLRSALAKVAAQARTAATMNSHDSGSRNGAAITFAR